MGNTNNEFINGPNLTPTGVIRVVVSSAAEAETGGLFSNMKEATILRTTLNEMGYKQPPTPVQVDNSTACGIANDNIKIQQSKAINMRFYWVRNRVDQGHFHVYWKPGKTNLADYVTKHHTTTHHQLMRPIYLHQAHYMTTIQNIFRNRTHCGGVLILSIPRDRSPVLPIPGRQTGGPAQRARRPLGKPIATIPLSQQAYLTCSS